MASEPLIYSQNWINAADTFSVSSGASSISLAYDRDKNSQYASFGANSDSTPVTIQVNFNNNGTTSSRTFDTLILINHNIKNYTVAWWTGSAWTTFITQTADASQAAAINASQYGNAPSALASFSAITTTQLLFTLNTTQTANQEKMIGELVCAALTINPLQDLAQYEVQPRVKQKVKILGDGSVQMAYVFWSPTQCQKYEATVGWKNLPYTMLTPFVTLKQTGAPFLWYPESITRPDDIYYVNWDDAIKWKYSAFYKFAGIDLTMYLREV
jgi:hypothetical protein